MIINQKEDMVFNITNQESHNEELPHVAPDPSPEGDPHPPSEPIRESPSERPPLPRVVPLSVPETERGIVPPDPPLDE